MRHANHRRNYTPPPVELDPPLMEPSSINKILYVLAVIAAIVALMTA